MSVRRTKAKISFIGVLILRSSLNFFHFKDTGCEVLHTIRFIIIFLFCILNRDHSDNAIRHSSVISIINQYDIDQQVTLLNQNILDVVKHSKFSFVGACFTNDF